MDLFLLWNIFIESSLLAVGSNISNMVVIVSAAYEIILYVSAFSPTRELLHGGSKLHLLHSESFPVPSGPVPCIFVPS